MPPKQGFRKGVCGIFISTEGLVLLGERLNEKGQWQLPQGGIEKNENFIEALCREMKEEVGISEVKVIRDSVSFISYRWPTNLFPNSVYEGTRTCLFFN